MIHEPTALDVETINKVPDIHSCGYYCERLACIRAQRDELRDRYLVNAKPLPVEAIEAGMEALNDAAFAEVIKSRRAEYYRAQAKILRALIEGANPNG